MRLRRMGFSAHALPVGMVILTACLVAQEDAGWIDRFQIGRADFRSTGRNPWFILVPGYQLVLEDGEARLVVTVLDTTRVVDGIETRVVEERETEGGALTEVSWNYFAIDARTNSVYYFGEAVTTCRDGVITGHEGSWTAGEGGARFGLMMPGLPLPGSGYYQEVAPGVAMDRARIVRTDDQLATPAGKFTDVLRVEETTPLEPEVREYKRYAPGVGLIQDGSLVLVRYDSGDVGRERAGFCRPP